MTNLLDETAEILKKHGLTIDNISWIGSEDGRVLIPSEDWANALDVNYWAGYGHEHPCYDLVVVGDDWWLSRGFGGDEGSFWIYNKQPIPSSSVASSDRAMMHGFHEKYNMKDVIGLKTRSEKRYSEPNGYKEVPASYFEESDSSF